MVTADDDSVTDIVVEGDKEEIERLAKVTVQYCLLGLGVYLHPVQFPVQFPN